MQGSGTCFDKLTHVWTCYMYWSLTEWLCVIFQSIQSVFGYGKMLMWQILMNESVVYSHCPTSELGCIDIFFFRAGIFSSHTPAQLVFTFLGFRAILRQKPKDLLNILLPFIHVEINDYGKALELVIISSLSCIEFGAFWTEKYPNYEIHLALGSSCFSAYT